MFVPIFMLLVYWLNNKLLASRTNFQVRSFKLCNNTQGLFKFNGNITREGSNYYGSGRVVLPIPLDENIGATCKIDSVVVNTWMELFVIREKNLCKAANMYLGELWYDVQRAAQVIPGMCPLPAGRYETHHVLIDFKKMSLQTFPFGPLRFTMRAVDNKNPLRKLLCLEMEVENIP